MNCMHLAPIWPVALARHAAVAVLCGLATLAAASPARAADIAAPDQPGISACDWPSWRGPTHDGHAAAPQRVPRSWSDTENVVWSADVPGRGSSSPTVVGDRVYLSSCDEAVGSQSVYAYDRASGRPVWTKQVHASGAMRKHERSTGASSSVTCDGERLFVAFPTSDAVVITALSLAGEQLWQTTLCDYSIHQGYGASPFLYQDTVLVVADHKGGGAVAALDRRTGQAVWKKKRPPFPNYSSPIVFHLFGRDQLILTGCDKVISYDPATGDTLWEREGATTECVTTPVTDGQRVFTSGGYPKNHVSAVRADGSAKIDWENGEREYVPSMLVHDGHLYGVLDAGIAVCWEAATGKQRWKHRLGGNFSASPVLLDDTIFATSETGETHVFRATPTGFESLGVNKLGDEAWATPTICGDRIYCRVATGTGDARKEKLVCIGPAASAPATPASAAASIPPCFGGRYPHLAVSNAQGECGIGAVVPWAGRLWFVTYAPHARQGSDDKLYEVDGQLRLTARPESVGGTPAARFIHDPTRQLLIGPYVIDEQGSVRAIPPATMEGRLSAAARHPTDPNGKVLVYDMEGLLYELDMRSYEPKLLFSRAAPGWHGKGMYSGQGVVVVANNGEHAAGLKNFEPFLYAIPNTRASQDEAGVLAEWSPADGQKAWRLVRRRQFTDITGPGGIHGPPSPDAPLWAIGWDEKSVLLMVRSAADAAAGRQPWHTFRLPKACNSFDGDHGWHTEWPRIREVVPAADGKPARYILTMHGGWYDFPASFSAESPVGIRPLCSHLKITGDVAPWQVDGRPAIVFGCDDTAKSGFKSEHQNSRNDLNGRSNSNLWFTTWEGLSQLGRPAGAAYAWRQEAVTAGKPSDPLLLAGGPGGYGQRVVHLAHGSDGPVSFKLEAGTGTTWREIVSLPVPAKGSVHHVLPADVAGDWIRVTADRDAADVTVVFRYGTRGGAAEDTALFAALTDAFSTEPWIAAVMRSGGGESLPLDVFARQADSNEAAAEGSAWRIMPDQSTAAIAPDDASAVLLRDKAIPTSPDVSFDAASVILTEGKKVFRLPKPLDPAVAAAYEKPFATGWPRGLREVVTERSLLNAAGTFYVLPRVTSGGAAKIQPVCSHGKRITDFCSWRGLLVLGGVRQSATPLSAGDAVSRVIGSTDPTGKQSRGPAVWVGDIDELWKLPRPTGRGGPWHDSPVQAGQPSDSYLMGGYDQKRLELSHDCTQPVRVTIEIDPTGDTRWFDYATLEAPAGKPLAHEFPQGFSCQWVRLRIDRECRATALFTYR